jgi:hypothetical protein
MNTHMDRLAAEVVSLRKTGGGGGGGLPKEFAEQWEVRISSPREVLHCDDWRCCSSSSDAIHQALG